MDAAALLSLLLLLLLLLPPQPATGRCRAASAVYCDDERGELGGRDIMDW
jgi:hypothetical protein